MDNKGHTKSEIYNLIFQFWAHVYITIKIRTLNRNKTTIKQKQNNSILCKQKKSQKCRHAIMGPLGPMMAVNGFFCLDKRQGSHDMFENQFYYKHCLNKTKTDMTQLQVGYMANKCSNVVHV